MTQTENPGSLQSWLLAPQIHIRRAPNPPGNCGQVLPSSRCFPLALAQVWGGYKWSKAGERLSVGYLVTSWGHLCSYSCK